MYFTRDEFVTLRMGLEALAGEVVEDIRERAKHAPADFGGEDEARDRLVEAERHAARARALLDRFADAGHAPGVSRAAVPAHLSHFIGVRVRHKVTGREGVIEDVRQLTTEPQARVKFDGSYTWWVSLHFLVVAANGLPLAGFDEVPPAEGTA